MQKKNKILIKPTRIKPNIIVLKSLVRNKSTIIFISVRIITKDLIGNVILRIKYSMEKEISPIRDRLKKIYKKNKLTILHPYKLTFSACLIIIGNAGLACLFTVCDSGLPELF